MKKNRVDKGGSSRSPPTKSLAMKTKRSSRKKTPVNVAEKTKNGYVWSLIELLFLLNDYPSSFVLFCNY